MKSFKNPKAARLWAAAAAVVTVFGAKPLSALAGAAVNVSGPVLQGTDNGSDDYADNNPAIVISFSGQTALRNFNTSGAITVLQPGTSITLHDGTGGAPVTYTATNDQYTFVQLGSPNFTSPDYWEDDNGNYYAPGTLTDGTVQDVQVNSAIETQWHEQGSVDGFYDLINDEIGYAQNSSQAAADDTYVGPISNESLRTPSSSNPTWINTNKFTTGGTIAGFALDNSAGDILDETYNTSVYNQSTGSNILGGQNRIQFSVGEYPTEAFAVPGTASPYAAPGSPGYGQGNPALTPGALLTALGTADARQTFQSSGIANESTAIDDPLTDTNYTSGPWNTAGANNITSTPIAATAVTYSANPGTGLYRLDLGDTQWLQTTGRLQNGALFDVVARTVDTGQRIVFAANTGIDPSWAVGSNDDGNSTSTTAANEQHSIGAYFRYDGKTSGSEAEKTIAQGRMTLGALSVPEARAAASNAPVRALDIDFTDQTDVNPADDSTNFIRASFSSMVSSGSNRYQAVLISHYNSVKTPNATALYNELVTLGLVNSNGTVTPANVTTTVNPTLQQEAWADVQSFNPSDLSDPTTSGIQGDPTGDVAAFISNIANSVAVAATGVNAPTSANDPADALLSIGFLLPDLLNWTRQTDGGPITPVTLGAAALAQQQSADENYGPLFTTDNSAAANANTIGSGSTYGDGNTAYTGSPTINGSIPITAKNVTWTNGTVTSVSNASNGAIVGGGNYLFGNFNQNGVRDYSDVQQAVNAALSLYAVDSTAGGANSIYGGVANSTVIPSLVGDPGWVQTGTDTKGDLIVLGDYNGDGSFNGEDLYLLAIGASLADNVNSSTLTATASTFSDVVRNPTNVLRKNTALNYINTYLNTTSDTTGALFLRQTAAAVLEGSTIPVGATNLHTTDPITGLEQFSYDPNGVNAFNPADVNRDGVVDFNDAVIVDGFNGQSYQNLTQSLAATEPTPVTGVTEPVSLVTVQQVDGESAIGSADLAAINTSLAETGNANWYDFNVQKTGPGTIVWGRTAGTVLVYSGASFEISKGTVDIGGTLDPFTDNSGLSTNGNHVAVAVDHGAALAFTQSYLKSTVSSLTIDTSTGSKADIGTDTLAINYGSNPDPIASIVSYLTTGYSGGSWTGAGITSSDAAANPGLYSVGYLNSTDNGGVPNQVIVKFTIAGDANLDGTINFADLLIVAQNFNKTGQDWSQGNFIYAPTGLVNFADLLLVAQHFNDTLAGGGSPLSLAGGGWSTIGLTTAVPEPSTVGLSFAVGAGLLARRRRRHPANS
jgi:hypothetical protein